MKKLILLIFVVAASLNAQAVQGQIGQVPVVAAADNSPVGGAGNLTTVGSVPYVSASGILNQDAGQFFWDATNDRLGIGTNAPTQSLHIWNSSTVNARIQTTGNASASVLFSRPNREFYVGNGPCTATDSFNVCDATASNSVRFLIDSTGNVGIGTTSPTYLLDVAKSGASGTFRAYDQTASTGSTLAVIRAGIAQSTNDLNQWQNNAGTVLSRVTSAGWLGIGAATPAYDLDIYRNSSNVGLQVGNSFGTMLVGPYTLSARPNATASAPRTNMYFDLNSGAGGTLGSWIFQNGSVNSGVLKITN